MVTLECLDDDRDDNDNLNDDDDDNKDDDDNNKDKNDNGDDYDERLRVMKSRKCVKMERDLRMRLRRALCVKLCLCLSR